MPTHVGTWCLPTARIWINEWSFPTSYRHQRKISAERHLQFQIVINLWSSLDGWLAVLFVSPRYAGETDEWFRSLASHRPPIEINLPFQDGTLPPDSNFTDCENFFCTTHRSNLCPTPPPTLETSSHSTLHTVKKRRQWQDAKHGIILT